MTHIRMICPDLPVTHWQPVSAPRSRKGSTTQGFNLVAEAFAIGANMAIELAYKARFPTHTVLVGSDFEKMGPTDTILLPKGSPPGWNDLLKQLRGLERQRRPDIIDFTDRRMYETKSANEAPAKGVEQLRSLIRLANEIRRNDAWDAGDWLPPHVMAFPSDISLRICTGETDYASNKGLIRYRVYRRREKVEVERRLAKAAVMTDLVPEMEQARERLSGELNRVAAQFEPDTDLWILCPLELWRATVLKPRIDSKPLPQTIDVRKYPLIALHGAASEAIARTGVIMLAATACIVVIAGSVLLVAEIAGAGVVAGATGATVGSAATAEGAAVVSLEAYRAARVASEALSTARQISSAAAALLVVVSTSKASAKAPTMVTDVSAVRAVSAKDIPVYYEYGRDQEILYLDRPYRIIGRARVGR